MLSTIVSDKPNVRWDDVAGLENAKQALQESVILPMRFPRLFTGMRKAWKGILLYGPPGTGKTHLARAVATEANATFFNVSPADLLSMWSGEGEKNVQNLFALAREKGNSVIFIDEIDSIARKERTWGPKQQLLTEMDGLCKSNTGVVVLAATNYPWNLEDSLQRRLEKRIYIPLPDLTARTSMFRIFLKRTPHYLSDDDLCEFAKKTAGYSGSDIEVLVRDALMEPVRKLQKATTFRTISVGKGKEAKEMIALCDPSDSGAMGMKLIEVDPDKLYIPKVTKSDFITALKSTKSSVDSSILSDHEKYTKEKGQAGERRENVDVIQEKFWDFALSCDKEHLTITEATRVLGQVLRDRNISRVVCSDDIENELVKHCNDTTVSMDMFKTVCESIIKKWEDENKIELASKYGQIFDKTNSDREDVGITFAVNMLRKECKQPKRKQLITEELMATFKSVKDGRVNRDEFINAAISILHCNRENEDNEDISNGCSTISGEHSHKNLIENDFPATKLANQLDNCYNFKRSIGKLENMRFSECAAVHEENVNLWKTMVPTLYNFLGGTEYSNAKIERAHGTLQIWLDDAKSFIFLSNDFFISYHADSKMVLTLVPGSQSVYLKESGFSLHDLIWKIPTYQVYLIARRLCQFTKAKWEYASFARLEKQLDNTKQLNLFEFDLFADVNIDLPPQPLSTLVGFQMGCISVENDNFINVGIEVFGKIVVFKNTEKGLFKPEVYLGSNELEEVPSYTDRVSLYIGGSDGYRREEGLVTLFDWAILLLRRSVDHFSIRPRNRLSDDKREKRKK